MRNCDSGDQAADWLRSQGASDLIEELAAVNDTVLTDLERTSHPKVAVLNRPELVHFVALVGGSVNAHGRLLRAVESPLVLKFFPLSGIWKSYAAALVNLHRGNQASAAIPKARGHEKYYLPYIRYMIAATRSEGEEARAAMAESFESRNRDRQFKDWYGLDGDGEQPVRWDFRRYAIDARRTGRDSASG